MGVGSIGGSYVQSLWHVYVTTGFLMALGAGGLTTPTGSSVAARWFEARRGLAIGLSAGGMSAGQLVIIPLAVWLTVSFGWRQSFIYLGILLFVIALPLTLLLRDDPAQKGLRAFGAGTGAGSAAAATPASRAKAVARRPSRTQIRATSAEADQVEVRFITAFPPVCHPASGSG